MRRHSVSVLAPFDPLGGTCHALLRGGPSLDPRSRARKAREDMSDIACGRGRDADGESWGRPRERQR